MKVQTLFNFLIATGILPIKFDGDGRVRVNWRFLPFAVADLILSVLFILKIYPRLENMIFTVYEINRLFFGAQGVLMFVGYPYIIWSAKMVGPALKPTANGKISMFLVAEIATMAILCMISHTFLKCQFLAIETLMSEEMFLIIGSSIMVFIIFTALVGFPILLGVVLEELLKVQNISTLNDVNNISMLIGEIKSLELGMTF